jgi:predicted SAM-dependent methyltransferase
MKLHIGGHQDKSGWFILDALPGPNVDRVGNCTDLSWLEDNSVEEIYASHVLEHLDYMNEIVPALQGFHRVLQPGGWVKLSVPDFEVMCRLFTQAGPSEQFQLMRMMMGGQTTPFDYHYVGLTFRFLSEYLEKAGFKTIERVEEFGLFPDTSRMRYMDVLISLNVQAQKAS